MFMQVIHAETEQTDENAVVKLIVDRMLNHIRELELNTTGVRGKEKANEMMNARPELNTNNAETAAYFNNYKIVREEMDLEKIYAGKPKAIIIEIEIIDIIFEDGSIIRIVIIRRKQQQ